MLYSAFLVAGLAGSRLSPVDSLVSELEVPGQPASGLFRSLDAGSGVLVAGFAAVLWYRRAGDRLARAGAAFLAGFGLCAVLDAAFPMSCTPSTDLACRQRVEQASILTELHQPHAVTGSLGILAVVLAMLLFSRARTVRAGSPSLARASRAAFVLLSALGLADLGLMYAGHGAGLVERGYLLVISAWLALLAWEHLTRRVS